MTYSEAVREMVGANGRDTEYSDGAQTWDGHNLLEELDNIDVDAAAEQEYSEDKRKPDFRYDTGGFGSRPGIYRVLEGDALDSVPLIEVVRE